MECERKRKVKDDSMVFVLQTGRMELQSTKMARIGWKRLWGTFSSVVSIAICSPVVRGGPTDVGRSKSPQVGRVIRNTCVGITRPWTVVLKASMLGVTQAENIGKQKTRTGTSLRQH